MPGRIVWDEYYLHKYSNGNSNGNDSKSDRGILSGLMSQPAFRAAVWLLIFLLLIFVLQEVRRKQRFIPALSKPQNDSLDFVKTIGRLYYEKGDHQNLVKKMAAYFRDHVRNRYKLSTISMDEKFVRTLHMKTGYPEDKISKIIWTISGIDNSENISSQKLTEFYRELEEFYKST